MADLQKPRRTTAGPSTDGIDPVEATSPERAPRTDVPRPKKIPSIDTHRQLIGRSTAMISTLAADPQSARMLWANPALAFESVGIEFSPEIRDHVLDTVRHSASARTRREVLRERLHEELGVIPRPADPRWLSTTLFTRLEVTPLDTEGRTPVYRDQIPPETRKALSALLPVRSRRVPAKPVPLPRGAIWRLDLDAIPPELPTVDTGPVRLPLAEAWFYLGKHALVRPLLEMGIIDANALPIMSRSRFDRVRTGERVGGMVDWISGVTFTQEPRNGESPG